MRSGHPNPRRLTGIAAFPPQHNQRLIPPSDGAIQNRRILRKTTLTMLPPRREERAHGQRPFAAAGGGRAGRGSRGILERSGAELAGLTRPPSAWLEAKGCVLACSGSSSPTAGLRGNSQARVPVRPEQGHLTGRWRITAARSVGFVETVSTNSHSGRMSGAPRPFPDLQRRAA